MKNKNQDLPLLILAGGLGTRLGPLVDSVPKPMLEVANKPFLELLIKHYYSYGIRKFYLLTSHLSHVIEEHFNNFDSIEDNISITILKEESPLGTGGAIKNALNSIQDDNFLVANGDTFVEFNLNELISLGTPSLVVSSQEDTSRYGEVILKDDVVDKFIEKNGVARSGLINAGIYYFDRDIFDKTNNKVFSLEKELLEKATAQIKLKALITDKYFIDIGLEKDYKKAIQELSKK